MLANYNLVLHSGSFIIYKKHLQVLGKYYFRIDPAGEGGRWRRSFGQEIYSPLLLAFTEVVKEWLSVFEDIA